MRKLTILLYFFSIAFASEYYQGNTKTDNGYVNSIADNTVREIITDAISTSQGSSSSNRVLDIQAKINWAQDLISWAEIAKDGLLNTEKILLKAASIPYDDLHQIYGIKQFDLIDIEGQKYYLCPINTNRFESMISQNAKGFEIIYTGQVKRFYFDGQICTTRVYNKKNQ